MAAQAQLCFLIPAATPLQAGGAWRRRLRSLVLAKAPAAAGMGSLWITTDRSAVDVEELSALLAATGQNCHQFPRVSNNGKIVKADPLKLRRALRYSDITVAVYVKGRAVPGGDYMDRNWGSDDEVEGLLAPLLWQNGRKCLVAFGRAISDGTLTASIHDLAVAPSMQRRGVGRRVLQRIVRYLHQRGIDDISALTQPETRPFFASCGFQPDILCSTTMLYTRTATRPEDDVKVFGRMALLVPPKQ